MGGGTGNFCGTPRKLVECGLSRGEDMMLDNRPWQRVRQIVDKMRKDAVSVFGLPASPMPELRSRLVRRAEDFPKVIEAPAKCARGNRAVGRLRLRARQR